MYSKELDQLRVAMLSDKNNAFIGSLLLSMNFEWDDSITTAATDGNTVFFNKDFFKSLSKEERIGVYRHELEHIARLHSLRKGDRDHIRWNIACDHVINLSLLKDKFSLPSCGQMNQDYEGKSEEEVYDLLPEEAPADYEGDLKTGTAPTDVIEKVLKAINQAKLQNQYTNDIGVIEKLINKFVDPKVSWTTALEQYLTDLGDKEINWSKRNRRFSTTYLPGKKEAENRLKHINFYFDVSGSMTDKELIQCISEIKYINDWFQPEKFNVIQFDWAIQRETDIYSTIVDNSIKIKGGGGTSLYPVKRHIEDSKCTLAIILSDLICDPMPKPETVVDIIWIVLNNNVTPKYGKTFQIRS